MRRVLQCLAGLSFAILLTGATSILPAAGFSEADRADLERVSNALNAIHTLEGNFVQIGPEGQIDQGRFYIEKPGRMRFEYAAPNPTLVVSDGRWVAVQNTRLNTTDRYALWTTPLDLILGDDLDLRSSPEVVGVEHQQGALVIDAKSHSGRVNGNISLVFSEPDLALKQWTVKDAQGLLTTVSVSNLKAGVALTPGLFVISTQAQAKKSE
ncbi:MAG TPA: outer membrane lipoprotein carrier protein LolA [Rhizomicrobium sp.]|jgi:outer membrane lipoprotein-sorting protein